MVKVVFFLIFLLGFGLPAFAIINGQEVEPPLFPQIVMLKLKSTFCTASIIGPRVVVTSASCAMSAKGQIQLEGKDFEVKLYPSPYFENREHDMGLGILNSDLPISPLSISNREIFIGESLEIFGFGSIKNSETLPSKLHRGSTWVSVMDPMNFVLSSKNVKQQVASFGDTGGPVITHSSGTPRVLGIIIASNLKDSTFSTLLTSAASQAFMKTFTSSHGEWICGFNVNCPSP